VGWDSSREEFQFIATDPGPVLLVTPELLRQAFQQKDGSWLLRGYTQPDYSEWCEFTIRTPMYQLAVSLLPQPARGGAATREASESLSEPHDGQVGWVPAPPLPPDASAPPVTFYSPRQEPVESEDVAVTPLDPIPTQTKTEEKPPVVVDTGVGMAGEQEWTVRYVWNDPTVRDNEERVIRVMADSDSAALRALHAEMRKLAEEPSYRVVAVVPSHTLELAS
jgi:hypothetical protein